MRAMVIIMLSIFLIGCQSGIDWSLTEQTVDSDCVVDFKDRMGIYTFFDGNSPITSFLVRPSQFWVGATCNASITLETEQTQPVVLQMRVSDTANTQIRAGEFSYQPNISTCLATYTEIARIVHPQDEIITFEMENVGDTCHSMAWIWQASVQPADSFISFVDGKAQIQRNARQIRAKAAQKLQNTDTIELEAGTLGFYHRGVYYEFTDSQTIVLANITKKNEPGEI